MAEDTVRRRMGEGRGLTRGWVVLDIGFWMGRAGQRITACCGQAGGRRWGGAHETSPTPAAGGAPSPRGEGKEVRGGAYERLQPPQALQRVGEGTVCGLHSGIKLQIIRQDQSADKSLCWNLFSELQSLLID